MIGAEARPVLLIEDTSSLQMIYRSTLERAGHRVLVSGTLSEGWRLFQTNDVRVVLLDLFLPNGDGLRLIEDMLAARDDAAIIAITANATISKAVDAMRAGAYDFLVKPFEEARLLSAVENALAARRDPEVIRTRPPKRPSPPAARGLEPDVFIGTSPPMREVQAKIRSVAPSMATVFITGESGTGKELSALSVHAQSPRASGPFIALNCGAIPEDLLESEVFGHIKGSFTGALSDKPGAATAADGGTLFLDEICEMAPALQTKLLRFLQTSTVQPVGATRPRKVNVRIICATNRDPLQAVKRGLFREDLFYRLFVVPLHMPPLRDRGEDVIAIAQTALLAYSREEGRAFTELAPEVADLFRSYPWPGNVRQLLNVIRNIVVLNQGRVVTPEMLPAMLQDLPETGSPVADTGTEAPKAGLDLLAGRTMAEIERLVIEETVARFGGSVLRAARSLDLAPSTIYRKIEGWQKKSQGDPDRV